MSNRCDPRMLNWKRVAAHRDGYADLEHARPEPDLGRGRPGAAAALAAGQTVEAAGSTTGRATSTASTGACTAPGLACWRRGTDLAAADLETTAGPSAGRATGPWPRFAWDFDDEGLGPPLARLLKVRALLHLLTVRTSHRRWRVRERQGRQDRAAPRLRIRSQSRQVRPTAAAAGHRRCAATRVTRRTRARSPADVACRPGPFWTPCSSAAGLQPRSYRSKFRAELTPPGPPSRPSRSSAAGCWTPCVRTRPACGQTSTPSSSTTSASPSAASARPSAHLQGVVDGRGRWHPSSGSSPLWVG